jgi:Kinesin motor domain
MHGYHMHVAGCCASTPALRMQADQPPRPAVRISRENIAVAIRCRPPDAASDGRWAWRLSSIEARISVNESVASAPALKRVISELTANRGKIANLSAEKAHQFDMVFDEQASTRQVYKGAAQPIVMSALDGINGAIMAYGQVRAASLSLAGAHTHAASTPGFVHLHCCFVKLRDRALHPRVRQV